MLTSYHFSFLTVCLWYCMQNPYLALTGPVRAVMIYSPVIFEATLYVKGATSSNDKELSLLATSLGLSPCLHSCLVWRSYRSRLSTLDLMLAHMTYSVEATIRVRVTSGTWPDGLCCRFVASTDSIGQSLSQLCCLRLQMINFLLLVMRSSLHGRLFLLRVMEI